MISALEREETESMATSSARVSSTFIFDEKERGQARLPDLRDYPTLSFHLQIESLSSCRNARQVMPAQGQEGGLAPAFGSISLQPHSFFCKSLNLSITSS